MKTKPSGLGKIVALPPRQNGLLATSFQAAAAMLFMLRQGQSPCYRLFGNQSGGFSLEESGVGAVGALVGVVAFMIATETSDMSDK